MAGKTIIITGASDGIGAAAARHLSALDEHVVLVGRTPAKMAAVASELGAEYFVADFADLSQVRELAARLGAAYPRIDVLANNAGGIMGKRGVTVDGFERTFQVNHLAPFQLTTLLLPTLITSRATVIQTASLAAKVWGRLNIDDLQSESAYTAQRAYGTAKLENILFTRELDRRYRDQGIAAVAFHPGTVATNFASESTFFMRWAFHTPVVRNLFTISAERSAMRLVWLAEGTPGTDWQPGGYYDRNRPARSSTQANDAALARALWDRSEVLLGRAENPEIP